MNVFAMHLLVREEASSEIGSHATKYNKAKWQNKYGAPSHHLRRDQIKS
jgi:hypothetical protein